MVSVRRVFAAVRLSASSIRRRIDGSKRRGSPMIFSRTPLRLSRSISFISAPWKSCMRSATSSGGRRQFSELNANSVRYSMPRSTQARTVARTVSTPRLWPATRGRWRRLAQRPLPSMMIATWRGTAPWGGTAWVELSCDILSPSTPLHRHQLGFFLLQQLVDLGGVPVGHLLHLVLGAALVVFRHLLLLQRLLQVVDRVAPQVAHRDAGVLGLVLDHLDQLLAPLLGE